jgi:hypothetical protein
MLILFSLVAKHNDGKYNEFFKVGQEEILNRLQDIICVTNGKNFLKMGEVP